MITNKEVQAVYDGAIVELKTDKVKKKVGVDFGFIREQEGFKNSGYVPDDPDNSSGVTIGSGIDLGYQNTMGLSRMGVDKELIAALKPYMGLTGDAAKEKLKVSPLNLSRGTAEELTTKVKQYYAQDVAKHFDKSGFKKKFKELPKEAQTVLVSVAFQHGVETTKGYDFWKEIGEERWEDAQENLKTWGGETPSRRLREAELLSKV